MDIIEAPSSRLGTLTPTLHTQQAFPSLKKNSKSELQLGSSFFSTNISAGQIFSNEDIQGASCPSHPYLPPLPEAGKTALESRPAVAHVPTLWVRWNLSMLRGYAVVMGMGLGDRLTLDMKSCSQQPSVEWTALNHSMTSGKLPQLLCLSFFSTAVRIKSIKDSTQ